MNFKSELKYLLSDEFIAKVKETKDGIEIKFLNGETYKIKIEAVA